MSANTRLHTLSDCIRHKANLRASCACGNSSVLCTTSLYRWVLVHGWNQAVETLGIHLRCTVCKGRPDWLQPVTDRPNSPAYGPTDEHGWKRLMRHLRS